MSAYVIVEATVLDAESRNRYASLVEPLFREFGAEVIAFVAVASPIRRARVRQRHDYSVSGQ